MQVIQDLTAFEERLGRVTSLKKLTGSAYGGMCVCVCVVCVYRFVHQKKNNNKNKLVAG